MNNGIFRRRNEVRSRPATTIASYSTLFGLAGLAVMLVAVAFLFINTSADDIDANGVQGSATRLTPIATSAVRGETAQVRESYGQLPLSFEANHGQADGRVDFVARGAGYALALSPTEAAFGLRKADCGSRNENVADSENPKSEIRNPKSAPPQSAICNPQSAVLRMNLVGANRAATVAGQNELEGRVNYFIGNDPAKWRTDVPTFGRVRYTEVYPGIDVVYYGNQRRLEYDFVVAPGRDARAIALEFAGAQKVEVDGATGDLLVHVGEDTIRQHAPITYQQTDTGRREVESRYAMRDGGRVGFEVGEYDASAPLVIDPVLEYSTYLGGSGNDQARDIAVDSAGNAYICGETTSTNFPTANAFDGTFNVGNTASARDAFVAKLNAAGTALVYSTYLGGTGNSINLSGDDACTGIAIDSAGNAYVAGETRSTDFPTANALQGTFNGGAFEGFLTKLNAAGSALVYSTFIGGDSFDSATSVAVDSSGSAYVAGRTTSSNFATVNPIQATFMGGGSDAFIMKFNAAGSALVYSTYLGGGGGNGFDAAFSIALDPSNNAYITGPTLSTDFPTANAIQGTFGGGLDGDAFVAKINAAGTALVYSTYLGGSDSDSGQDITVDSGGNAHVTGSTSSTNFPTANAFDSTLSGSSDAFVTKLNAAGSAFVYSTLLGGTGGDAGNDIVVDSSGNAHIAGGTSSTDFPTLNPIQGTFGGGTGDAFVTKFNAAGSALVYSTYFGGGALDRGNAIAVDSASNVYVAGISVSTNFPRLNPIQGTNAGGDDAFVTKISDPSPSPATIQFSNSNYTVSEGAGFVNINVIRSGDTSTAVAVDYTTSDNSDVIPDEAQAVALCAGVNSVALSKCDFNTAVGTLRFASGETTKVFTVLLTQDSYVEGTEFAPLTLSNPTNGAVLGNQSTAMLQITDDVSELSTNAIDDARNFVRQHYHDFLDREPDQAGWDFWTDNIAKCNDPARRPAGQTVEQCIDKQRETTSGAFFLSPEFQYTGSYIYGVYRGSLNRRPTFLEFMRDLPQLVNGIIVGGAISGPAIEANRAQYVAQFVQRTEFLNIYGALGNQGYVDKLFLTTGTSVSDADRQALVTGLNGGTETRSSVLHKVVNGTRVIAEGQIEIIAVYGKTFYDTQFNPAFVQMEYFGYMRRNEDTAGFNFWLGKLNFYGDFITAEMVRSFLLSPEYRRRFGSQ